jgi:two-component system, NarL family, sensor kinase
MDAQESQIYITIIIAVIVFGFVIGYFFYSINSQHKRMRKLERINADAQVQMLEKDRQRIAADMHDDIAPILTKIRSQVERFDLRSETDKENRRSIKDEINELSQRVHAISFDLMPGTLKENGLLAAIAQFVNHASNEKNMSIRLHPTTTEILMDQRGAIHVFSMLKEIVHNTIKHAQATELVIKLSREKGFLIMATKDNGIGFDYRQELEAGNGLGLKSLMNRVYLLQADFFIDTKPGKGTSITIRIPY